MLTKETLTKLSEEAKRLGVEDIILPSKYFPQPEPVLGDSLRVQGDPGYKAGSTPVDSYQLIPGTRIHFLPETV